MNRRVPVTLTIAGSDNSGGAGIQADLKTFTRYGVYGTTAVTCVVAEHPGRVSRITAEPPSMVAEQIRLVFEVSILGWVALAPLLLAVRACSAKEALAYSYAAGVVFFSGLLYWLVNVSVPGYIILVLYIAVS